jgi:hypothetical protein
MKTVLLVFFLTTLSAALPCYGATADEAKGPQNGRAAAQQADRDRAAKKARPHGSTALAKPNHLQPPPSNQKRLATRKLADPQRSASGRSTGPPIGAPAVSKAASRTRSAQPPGTSRTSIAASNDFRHRSPNPATVGGSASSRAAQIGSLNGNRMGRRP